MGTFHDGMGDLHGITVVVDTRGRQIHVGRCWQQTAEGITLLDLETHQEGEDGLSKEEFVQRAYQRGFRARQARLIIPRDEIASVTPLGRWEGARTDGGGG